MLIRRFSAVSKRGTLLVLSLLLALMGLSVQPSGAQQLQQDQMSKFQLAESYLRSGQYDRAIRLLEDLRAANPQLHVFNNKLKQAYENVKRYDDALTLVESQLDTNRTPVLVAEKARLTYLKGDEQTAFSLWDDALALAPDRRSTYRVVYASLLDNRLFGKAIEVLEKGQETLDAGSVFRLELARLYSLTGRHEEAIAAYLDQLNENERQLSLIQSRLSRYTDKEGALKQYIAGTKRVVRETPLYRPYRELLAWLHMEAEQYHEALDAVRAIDRLEQEQGRSLYHFVYRMANAGAYDVALEGYQEILERYPDAPSAPQAKLGLGIMHEKWAEKNGERAAGTPDSAPHYKKALDTYRDFLDQYPNHARYAEVLRRVGRLQQDVFHDLEEAHATLSKVIEEYPGTSAARQARYDLGRIAVRRGDLQDARLAFSRLEEDLRTGELADKARYQLALLHFYRGEFESALTLANALNQNTSKDVANDAIELKVLLLENKGPDSLNKPLKTFARARLLQRQRHHDETLQTLDTLLDQHGRHPLADDTRFLRAQTMRASGRYEDALKAFLEMPLIHPRSHLLDRSLFEAAQIQEQQLNDPQAALETYTRLLTDHPASLLASDARSRIRALRGRGV